MKSRAHPLVSWPRLALPLLIALSAAFSAALGPGIGGFGPSQATRVPVEVDLAESPPAHPPAAPCGGCAQGCGAGPSGIPGVYLHSGEVHLQEVDLVIPGRGLDFVWARTYRSRLGRDTVQGHGWDFSYNASVERDGTAVRVRDGGGRSDRYEPRPDGSFAAAEHFREGRFEPDGTFTLEFADRGRWSFFALDGGPLSGKLRTIVDRNGNTLGFDYDGLGRLNLVVDTLGRSIQVAYGANGRIASLTDFLGRQVVYQYYTGAQTGGGAGDLRSARSPVVVGTPNGNDFPAGKTTKYTYSAGFADDRLNHNLLTVVDPRGNTTLVNEYAVESDPRALRFDRLVRQTRGDPGDVIDVTYELVSPAGTPRLLAIVNDRVGNVSEHEYDLFGLCVALRRLTGRADPDQPTTRTSNRPTSPLRPGDPPWFETRWTYNADSLATRIVHPNGNETHSVYELELDPQAAPRSRGNLRVRTHLPGTHLPVGDQPMLTETYEYDTDFGGCCGSNFVTRHTDARGNTTEHDYDACGNRLQTRHRIPSIVEDFTYNAFGQMTGHVHADNGKGWRQVDQWTYYGPAHGHQNGYLRSERLDAAGFGLTTVWTHDGAGNALSVRDARGNTTTFVVNALNQVVRQLSPPVQMMNGVSVQYQVDTWYDENDNVVRVDTKNFDDQGALSANAFLTTTWEYEVLDRQVRKTEEVGVGADVVTEYEYDANRNRTLTRFGEATGGGQPANVERWLYDERDLLFRAVRAEGDPSQSSNQHDYDPSGHPVRVTRGLEDAAPRVTTWTFDAYGRAVAEGDPMGNVTTRNFDPNGNLVHVRVDGEECDVPGSAGNVRLFEASFTYDAMDRPLQSHVAHFDPATQAPVGDGLSRTTRSWTDRSDVAAIVDDNGNVTSFCYDTAGRRELVTDAAGNSVRQVHDQNGNVVQVVETEVCDLGTPDQVFTSTRLYDSLDRQVLDQDSLGNEVAMGYDSRDNPTRVVDALGNVTTQVYDGLDRLVGSTRVLSGGAGSIQRAWSWDRSSRLVALTDANGNATRHVYDALGRRVRTVFADTRREDLSYDALGNVVARRDPNGTTVDSTYDLADRLSGRSVSPGAGVSSDTTFEVWKHDGLSRLVHAQDDDSLVTCEWDSLSNRVHETQNGKTFVCTHDGMRNELVLTYPGGVQVACTYDALNRVKTVTNAGPAAVYDYIGPRRVQRRTTGGGVATSLYGYDGARRTTSIHHLAGTATVDHRTFQWDAMYNRTRSTDVPCTTGACVRNFSYDAQYRLTRSHATTPFGVTVSDVRYTYDGVGNRTAVSGGACAGPYVMDATPREPADRQMNQYTTAPCPGGLAYDANGNQIARAGGVVLEYDYRDRLVLHQDAGGNVTSFAYDALGRNIAQTRGQQVTRYYYHGMDVVEERDGADAVRATYVRGRALPGPADRTSQLGFNPQPEPPIGREIVEREAGGQRLYFFADDLGSTRVVTSADGGVVERYDYDEAGLPSFRDGGGAPLSASAIGNAWLFTGQRWDAQTGFYYYRSRYMDPLLGQFLSRDPIGLWGDPVNLGNGRTYVGNNFQTLTDPTGMRTTACAGPWSGTKTVRYDYVDCSSNSTIPDALCRAKGGAYAARRSAKLWVSYELLGYPGGWSWLVAVPFLEWFGGPNKYIPVNWMLTIYSKLDATDEPFRKGESIGIECETGCDPGVNAYIAWYDSNVHLCPRWWGSAQTRQGRAGILLHELSHEHACTVDNFYYFIANKASTFNFAGMEQPNLFETNVLANNADTYEGLYLDWFIK